MSGLISNVPLISAGGAATADTPDISATYTTETPKTANFTITGTGSTVVPVDSTSGGFVITLNDSVAVDTRVRVHDSYNACGTNPVTINSGASVEIAKLNTDGGAVEFAWSGASWLVIDRFENLLDRNELTGDVSLREAGDTLVAGSIRTGSGGTDVVGTGDFVNAGANIDQKAASWGNGFVNITGFTVSSTEAWTGIGNITDGNYSTYGHISRNATTIDLIFDHGVGITKSVLRYRYGGGGFASRSPNDFRFQGSTDNATWVDLDVQTDQAGIEEPNLSEWFEPSIKTAYRYHRFLIESNNGDGSWVDVAEFEMQEPASTDNTWEAELKRGESGTYQPSSLVLRDENNVIISGAGKVNIATSIDDGAWSGLQDFETYKGDADQAFTSSFEIRLQPVGAQRVKTAALQQPATYARMATDGLEVLVDGQEVAKIKTTGLTTPSGSIGQAGIVFNQSVADGDFTNPGANVDQQTNDWGNDIIANTLIQSETTDGSTTFTDTGANPKTVTATGGVQHDTAQSQFGSSSILFDGVDSMLSLPDDADWDVGSGDFTIDFWLRRNSTTGLQNLFDFPAASDGAWTTVGLTGTNIYTALTNNGTGLQYNVNTSGVSITTGQWYHIAVVRNGDEVKTYVDGTARSTITTSAGYSIYNTTGPFCIGRRNNGTRPLDGWLEEFRFLKGTAIWTADFTPPTSPYSATSATTNNTFDTELVTGAGGLFVPSTLDVRDENGTEITTDDYNIAWQVDSGAFTALEARSVFIARDTISYTSQFALRFQAVGSQRISEANLTTPDQTQEIGSNGENIWKKDQVEYARMAYEGLELPQYTTTNRDAISSPRTGSMIYNTTTNKLNFYNGTAWEAVTSA